MRRKARPFRDLSLERLGNREVAKYYLIEALAESQESFLKALRTVAQAYKMAQVAKEANMQRESLYRTLSETGNPTMDNLIGVLAAVGLRLSIDTGPGGADTGVKELAMGNDGASGCIEHLQLPPQFPCSHERLLNSLFQGGYVTKKLEQQKSDGFTFPLEKVGTVHNQETYGQIN